jgi:hypothetical protein
MLLRVAPSGRAWRRSQRSLMNGTFTASSSSIRTGIVRQGPSKNPLAPYIYVGAPFGLLAGPRPGTGVGSAHQCGSPHPSLSVSAPPHARQCRQPCRSITLTQLVDRAHTAPGPLNDAAMCEKQLCVSPNICLRRSEWRLASTRHARTMPSGRRRSPKRETFKRRPDKPRIQRGGTR